MSNVRTNSLALARSQREKAKNDPRAVRGSSSKAHSSAPMRLRVGMPLGAGAGRAVRVLDSRLLTVALGAVGVGSGFLRVADLAVTANEERRSRQGHDQQRAHDCLTHDWLLLF